MWFILERLGYLIQDTDPNKPNYGIVAETQEIQYQLTNGNGPNQGAGSSDRCIALVDYNAELDQIRISWAKFRILDY